MFVYVADRDEENVRRAAGEIAAAGALACFVRLDVTSEGDCASAESLVRREHGRLGVLVNNAEIR